MSSISNFDLTKPIRLFDSVWKERDLVRIAADKEEEQVGDVTTLSFWFGSRVVYKPTDLWGIDWSAVPDAAWNEREVTSSFQRIGKYKIAYLRFTVTVLNGRVGDSMLFLFNQPNTTQGSGLHAAVHVEVGPELSDDSGDSASRPILFGDRSVRRATAVEQHLIRGWDIGEYDNGQSALSRMKNVTEVRFLGLSKQSNIEVHAKCILLGGMF